MSHLSSKCHNLNIFSLRQTDMESESEILPGEEKFMYLVPGEEKLDEWIFISKSQK